MSSLSTTSSSFKPLTSKLSSFSVSNSPSPKSSSSELFESLTALKSGLNSLVVCIEPDGGGKYVYFDPDKKDRVSSKHNIKELLDFQEHVGQKGQHKNNPFYVFGAENKGKLRGSEVRILKDFAQENKFTLVFVTREKLEEDILGGLEKPLDQREFDVVAGGFAINGVERAKIISFSYPTSASKCGAFTIKGKEVHAYFDKVIFIVVEGTETEEDYIPQFEGTHKIIKVDSSFKLADKVLEIGKEGNDKIPLAVDDENLCRDEVDKMSELVFINSLPNNKSTENGFLFPKELDKRSETIYNNLNIFLKEKDSLGILEAIHKKYQNKALKK